MPLKNNNNGMQNKYDSTKLYYEKIVKAVSSLEYNEGKIKCFRTSGIDLEIFKASWQVSKLDTSHTSVCNE